MLKTILKRFFEVFGYEIINTKGRSTNLIQQALDADAYHVLPKDKITYAHDLLYTYNSCDFMTDPRFIKAYAAGKATDIHKSIFDNCEIYWRIHVLCWAASQAIQLEGDFVDCGVNTGIFARAVIDYTDFDSTGKKYYLLDTFAGLDERYSTEKEFESELNQKYIAGKDTLYNEVKTIFEPFNTEIIKGTVPDTLSRVKAEKVAYLSVDMNCVEPEVAALKFFWDKLVKGGIIILDDYGYANYYKEQKAAHDAFAASKGVEILTLPTCQGLIIKPY